MIKNIIVNLVQSSAVNSIKIVEPVHSVFVQRKNYKINNCTKNIHLGMVYLSIESLVPSNS